MGLISNLRNKREACVKNILRTLNSVAVIAVLGAFLSTGTVHRAFAQGGQAQPTKKVKDQGEYDLYNNVVKETDPAKKLQYLNQWVEKYPETDYQEEQLQFFNQLNQPAKVLEMGQKMLAKDPKNLVALSLITANIQKIQNPTPDQLANAQKAAQSLLDNLDSLKPASVTDDAWKQAKPGVEQLAKGTIEWIVTRPAREAMEKKDYPTAEAAYSKLVQQYPDNWQYAYQLGSVLVSEKNVEKYPTAIYEIARGDQLLSKSVASTPALQQQLTQIDAYLKKIYTSWHGSDEGLDQLKQQALAAAMPPANFHIKTAAEIATEQANAFAEKYPQLTLWLNIKKQLADTNGETYFESQLKNAAVPKLKGTLVDAKPACRPKELLVAVPTPDTKPPLTAEITLKLDMPLKGKPATGTEFQWEGVPSGFTRDPFMLTMDTEQEKVEGLQSEACAAAPAKKGVAKKKKQ